MIEKFIFENGDSILYSIDDYCNEKDISTIVTVAKKGVISFEKILLGCSSDLVKKFRQKYKIIRDRNIYISGSVDDLNGNILLFEDSIKTGRKFDHVADYITRSIINSKYNNIDSEEEMFKSTKKRFFYYALIKCIDTRLSSKFNENHFKYYCNKNLKDYYNFCLDEAWYFQKSLIPTSMNLPIFHCCITNINDLVLIFNNNPQFNYLTIKVPIKNNYIDLGILHINIDELINVLGGFLIAPTCKFRYEYNEIMDRYEVLIVPQILTDSIKYEEIEVMYNKIFGEKFKATNEKEMSNNFIRLYRLCVYVISYSIGKFVCTFLEKHEIKTKLDKKEMNLQRNCILQEKLREFDDYKYLINKLADFHYTAKESEKNKLIEYSLEKIKLDTYQIIVVSNLQNEYSDTYNYGFKEMNKLAYIYKTSNNLINFIKVIYSMLENYSIENEIELNETTFWIERGFAPGESSMSILPFEDKVFFAGLERFYQKVNGNYDYYMQNYNKFIKKFYTNLEIENFFDEGIITPMQFNYYTDYYGNVTRNNFKIVIESKYYILDNVSQRLKFIQNIVDFFLDSTDFNIN